MTNQNNQVRFGVIWNNIPYALFSVFTTKDETICLTTYGKISKIGTKKISTKGERNVHYAINIREVSTFNFSPQKVSFHPSGYIHDTNKEGKRLTQLDGQRGIQFEKIIDCATLFSLYPTTPDKYEKHTDLTKSIQLVDIQSYGFIPYQITCYLSKSDYDFNIEVTKLNMKSKSLFLTLKNYLPKHNLDLIVRFHKSSSDTFPTEEALCYSINFD